MGEKDNRKRNQTHDEINLVGEIKTRWTRESFTCGMETTTERESNFDNSSNVSDGLCVCVSNYGLSFFGLGRSTYQLVSIVQLLSS